MDKKSVAKSMLGGCTDLPIEAQLAEGGGAGRATIEARLTAEIERVNDALLIATPVVKKELILLVECLRAARQVVERSVSFRNARN